MNNKEPHASVPYNEKKAKTDITTCTNGASILAKATFIVETRFNIPSWLARLLAISINFINLLQSFFFSSIRCVVFKHDENCLICEFHLDIVSQYSILCAQRYHENIGKRAYILFFLLRTAAHWIISCSNQILPFIQYQCFMLSPPSHCEYKG